MLPLPEIKSLNPSVYINSHPTACEPTVHFYPTRKTQKKLVGKRNYYCETLSAANN